MRFTLIIIKKVECWQVKVQLGMSLYNSGGLQRDTWQEIDSILVLLLDVTRDNHGDKIHDQQEKT